MCLILHNWRLRLCEMGNDGACNIVGIGNMCLLTSKGCRLMLHDVGHVVNIKFNLILAGRLDDEGYSGGFQNGTWKFCKGNLIVARTQKQSTHVRIGTRLTWQSIQPESCGIRGCATRVRRECRC